MEFDREPWIVDLSVLWSQNNPSSVTCSSVIYLRWAWNVSYTFTSSSLSTSFAKTTSNHEIHCQKCCQPHLRPNDLLCRERLDQSISIEKRIWNCEANKYFSGDGIHRRTTETVRKQWTNERDTFWWSVQLLQQMGWYHVTVRHWEKV